MPEDAVGANGVPVSVGLLESAFDEIAEAIEDSYFLPQLNVFLNQRNLAKYVRKTNTVWQDIFMEK